MNTLGSRGLERARQKYSIRHTEKIREHVHQARRILDLSIDYYKQFKHTGDQLASERFTETQLRRVLDELYPSGPDDTASDRARRSRARRQSDGSPSYSPAEKLVAMHLARNGPH